MPEESNRMRGSHGLPAGYRTPEGETEPWEAAVDYLAALVESSKRPVVVVTLEPRLANLNRRYGARLTEQIGFLRRLPVRDDYPYVHRFALNWPDRDQPCGQFIVDERLYEGATLSTNDGDDYFCLRLDLGSIALALLDANTNMDHAYAEWASRRHQTYLTLPSAREIEEKWAAEPNRRVIKNERARIAELRASMVARGVTTAREMTDAELAAAAERVSWHLRTSGRMSGIHHSEWLQLYLDELAAQLGEA